MRILLQNTNKRAPTVKISNNKHQITNKFQISISNDQNSLICSFSDILSMFGILNFGHYDLPFDLAQGGELVEPFDICDLEFPVYPG